MRIPAGAQSGSEAAFARSWVARRNPAGDQFVQLKVVLPPADTP